MKKNYWHLAVASDSENVENFLKQIGDEEDVNQKNNIGAIPLMFAISRNKKRIASALIKRGANINFAQEGNTPISLAISKKNAEIIKMLLDSEVKTTTEQNDQIEKILQKQNNRSANKIAVIKPPQKNYRSNSVFQIPEKKPAVSFSSNSVFASNTSVMESNRRWQEEYDLSKRELEQVEAYIQIYKNNNFTEHYQVNNYITQHQLWDNFQAIRALNDHGCHKAIPGILPKFYAVVCKILHITGGNGLPLDHSAPY